MMGVREITIVRGRPTPVPAICNREVASGPGGVPLDCSVSIVALFQRSVFPSVRLCLDGPTARYINLSHMQARLFVVGASRVAAAMPFTPDWESMEYLLRGRIPKF
jgi:hypothetical protein